MGPPGPFGDAPLMMSGEASRFPHKTKRRLLSHPSKPLRGIRCKGEQTAFGTGHGVASLRPVLDARQDVRRLGRRFGGSRTRAGSGGGGCGWMLGRGRQWGWNRLDLLLEQGREMSHLLL